MPVATIGRSPIAPTEAVAETGDRLRPLPKGERDDRQVGEGILAVEGYIWASTNLSIPQSRYTRHPPLGKGALLSANQRHLQTPICPTKSNQARHKLYLRAFTEIIFTFFSLYPLKTA